MPMSQFLAVVLAMIAVVLGGIVITEAARQLVGPENALWVAVPAGFAYGLVIGGLLFGMDQ